MLNEMVNFLHTGDELEFAELFVKYYKVVKSGDDLTTAEDIDLTADDMNTFDLDGFLEYMKNVLGEIIFSEEIESSAWWKQEEQV